MNEQFFFILIIVVAPTATKEISNLSNASFATSVYERESFTGLIDELLGEIREMKSMQKQDREAIRCNREEILKLKKENEKLRAVIEANSDGHDLDDQKLAKDPDELEVPINSRIIRKANGFTLAPAPTPTQSPRKAAFSAKLSPSDHQINTFETIKFDVVITNAGGHYSSTTGIFTAPEDGTYFFLATTFSCYKKYIETYIKRNGENLVPMHVDDLEGHKTGAAGIVLDLSSGDNVYVEKNADHGECICGEFSNFSGFQI